MKILERTEIPRSAQQEFELMVRPFSLSLQGAGALMALLSWIIAPSNYIYPQHLLIGLLFLLAITIPMSAHIFLFAPLSTVNMWVTAFCYTVIVEPSTSHVFWYYILCILFMLSPAILYLRARDYLVAAVGLIFIFNHGGMARPPVSGREAGWALQLGLSALVTGILLNAFFAHWYRKNFQLKADLKALAYHDPLTGLGNRRQLLKDIAAVTAGAKPGACCFLMIDVDDFKSVNDKLGHEVGDSVLVQIAGVLQQVFSADAVGRLGGEEFGALVTHGGRDRAAEMAAKVLAGVRRIKVGERSITVSIGMTHTGANVAEMLRYADLALYQAKHQGKNQAVLFELSGLSERVAEAFSTGGFQTDTASGLLH